MIKNQEQNVHFAANRKFLHWAKSKRSKQNGITLLLVVVITTALFSITLEIFNIVFGEVLISGEIADSFVASYAADEGIEKILYRDRVLNDSAFSCDTSVSSCTFNEGPVDVKSGGCYKFCMKKTSTQTKIDATGQYRCGANPTRVVKRAFEVCYPIPPAIMCDNVPACE